MSSLEAWQVERCERCAKLKPEVAAAVLSGCFARLRMRPLLTAAIVVDDKRAFRELSTTRDALSRLLGSQVDTDRVRP